MYPTVNGGLFNHENDGLFAVWVHILLPGILFRFLRFREIALTTASKIEKVPTFYSFSIFLKLFDRFGESAVFSLILISANP